MLKSVTAAKCLITFLAGGFLAFGIYNVHSVSAVTEGGVLGLVLLFENWWNISPAVSGFILNALCYALGIKILGKTFLVYSAFSTVGFSLFYKIFEQFEPLFKELYAYPLAASLIGALFVGIGCGVCVRIGGAPGGDDALAMSISHITKLKIQWVYLISDLTVLSLSLTYISPKRIVFSLITVILSGQIVGLFQSLKFKSK